MNAKLGEVGRTLLILIAGGALVATTLATSDVSASVNGHTIGRATTCSTNGGLKLGIGRVEIFIC